MSKCYLVQTGSGSDGDEYHAVACFSTQEGAEQFVKEYNADPGRNFYKLDKDAIWELPFDATYTEVEEERKRVR